MPRWEPDARGRLRAAALESFAERGYESTTAARIAERAGLTERTFFRHFKDKREVLFGGQDALQEVLLSAVAAAPEDARPIDAIAAGLQAMAEHLEHRRDDLRKHAAIVTVHPELQERELSKLAALSRALAESLTARGLDTGSAEVAAEIAIAVFRIASERWTADPRGRPLSAHATTALAQAAAVLGGQTP
jgi:AcrR family transcriptional regulator